MLGASGSLIRRRSRRRRRRVINQTPGLQEIKNTANGTNVSNDGFADFSKGDFFGEVGVGVFPESLNYGVPVVFVYLGVLGG